MRLAPKFLRIAILSSMLVSTLSAIIRAEEPVYTPAEYSAPTAGFGPQLATPVPPVSDPHAPPAAVEHPSGSPAPAAQAAWLDAENLTDSATPSLEKRVAELEAAAKKMPKITVSGVFQADMVYFDQDPTNLATFGRIQNGADFRRARLAAAATVTENMNAFMQMDFAFFGRPTFTDLWLEMTHLPRVGTFRIGQWKQPFSLEVVSSFRYTTFMERSTSFQPFTPFRHLGAGFYNNSQDLKHTWAASVFASGQDQFGGSLATDGGVGTAERVTWLPYYDEPANGRYYLHLGLGHFFSAPPRDIARFRSVPEIFVGEFASSAGNPVGTSGQAVPNVFNGTPFFVDTGNIAVNHFNVIGTELLWVNGPFSLQTEGFVNFVGLPGGATATLPSFYTQVGYFLTGEHRPYNRVAGAIDRVMPFEDFFRVRDRCQVCSGTGAVEVAARLSHLDLIDAPINGGTITDFTAGVNWYLNPYSKLVFNYIHSWVVTPATGNNDCDIFAARAQVDF